MPGGTDGGIQPCGKGHECQVQDSRKQPIRMGVAHVDLPVAQGHVGDHMTNEVFWNMILHTKTEKNQHCYML
eukprot:316064-Heterocapsa_arctica.AAC.1